MENSPLKTQIENFRILGVGHVISDIEGFRQTIEDPKSLTLDPENAMAHPQENSDAIWSSLNESGFRKSSVAVREGDRTVFAGNGIVSRLIAEGIDVVPVVWIPESFSNLDAKRFALADNQSARLAQWIPDQLNETLEALADADYDISAIGFDDTELEKILAELDAEPRSQDAIEDDFDEPVPSDPVSQTGDLWTLGNHRVLCGDCTDGDAVSRLMDGQNADLLFTSPPYWHQRDYHLVDFDWNQTMRGAFSSIPLAEDGQILVNLGLIHENGEWFDYWRDWVEYMRKIGYKRFGWYVWDKLNAKPMLPHGRLASSFEFVFHFNKSNKAIAKWIDKKPESIRGGLFGGDRQKDGSLKTKMINTDLTLQATKIPDSVIRMNPEKGRGIHTENHPAVFPVELPSFMMKTWTRQGNTVLDPFLGSGTTLIACEELNRRCFGMEIEPRYVDLIVKRFVQFTDSSQGVYCTRDNERIPYGALFTEQDG